ncbi:MAG: hypothetical protein U5K28_10445 [Halobacteriales archaeon]|nr:hypothetical protein [Halobacteriales archaeon]
MTIGLAVAVVATAIVAGPLVPAVSYPTDSTASDAVYSGFGGDAGLELDRQLAYQLADEPTITVSDGVVETPTTVTVQAGADPVALRYQLRNETRSTIETATVPAGEVRTVTRTPRLEATGQLRLNVTATTDGSTFLVHHSTFNVSTA